jgi:hypothetical protein
MTTAQLLDWPADQPLRMSGPPASFRFSVSMTDVPPTTVDQQQVVLVDVCADAGAALKPRSLTLGLGAVAGGAATGTARLRLDPGTPPGIYTGQIKIGDATRPIEINVVEQVKLSIRPAPLVFDRASGLSQTFAVTFENKGNVALTIDVSGDYPLGLELPITSGRGNDDAPSGLEQLTNLFSGLLGTRGRPALRDIGTINLAMPQGALRLEPGATQTGLVRVTVPDSLAQAARFRAYVPVYIADLEIAVVTASKKSRPPIPKQRSKGAVS